MEKYSAGQWQPVLVPGGSTLVDLLVRYKAQGTRQNCEGGSSTDGIAAEEDRGP